MENFDLSGIPTVTSISENTNNTFFVFGEFPNGLKASIRLWAADKFKGQTEASLMFRVRVGDKSDGPICPEDFNGLGFNCWTGGAGLAKHRSISGAIKVQRTMRDVSHREEFLAKFASATADLEAVLRRAFPTLTFSMNPGQFSALLDYQASLAFPLSDFEEELAPFPVRLFLGGGVGSSICLIKVPGLVVHESFQKSDETPKKKPKKPVIVENLNDYAGL